MFSLAITIMESDVLPSILVPSTLVILVYLYLKVHWYKCQKPLGCRTVGKCI